MHFEQEAPWQWGGGYPEEGSPLGDGATDQVTDMMDAVMLPERSVCPRPGDGDGNGGGVCFSCWRRGCDCEEESEWGCRGIGPPVARGVGGGARGCDRCGAGGRWVGCPWGKGYRAP